MYLTNRVTCRGSSESSDSTELEQTAGEMNGEKCKWLLQAVK